MNNPSRNSPLFSRHPRAGGGLAKTAGMTLWAMLFLMHPAIAQTTPASPEKPLEITADQTLEWHRNDKKYIARGKAEAKQGLTQINAETLTADYRETNKSNFDIYRMTATDNVVITSQGNQAFGDKAVYELETGIATMTGDALKMTAPDQTITARDKFEYDVNHGRLSAYGNVIILRGTDKIQADKASAFFVQDGQAPTASASPATSSPMGGRQLERFEGEGNVVVTTPTEILKGDRGIYKTDSNTAEVLGNVKIIRGPNVLEGNRAEINLTTNVSRMFGDSKTTSTTGKGRVKGVFFPGSSKGEASPAAPATPATATTAPSSTPAPTPQSGSGQTYTLIPDENPASIPPPLTPPADSLTTP